MRCASAAAAAVRPPWRGGAVEGAAFLRRTAKAESQSTPVGVHAKDARLGRDMHINAMRAGWLDPRCPGHALASGGARGRGWAPRGAWGVSAAYGLRHLGWLGCLLGPAILDDPRFGALAAAGHARHCARVRRTRDPDELRVCWAGGHKSATDVVKRWQAQSGRSRGHHER